MLQDDLGVLAECRMRDKHKMKDVISLHGIPANLAVGADAWGRPGKPQPVIISFNISYAAGIQEAAAKDDVSKTMDYGKFYKAVRATLDNQDHGFSDIKALLRVLHNCVPLGDGVEINVYLPKASIRAAGGIRYTDLSERELGGKLVRKESVSILDIRCTCLLGVNPHERLEKQPVAVDLLFCSSSDNATAVNAHLPCENYSALAKAVAEV